LCRSASFDEEGRLVREVSVINIDDRNTWEVLEHWVTRGTVPVSPSTSGTQIPRPGRETAAEARVRSGTILLEQGRRDEAITQIREAFTLDPENWIIRKQIWVLEHPEKFYAGPVDYEWQKEQIERENAELGGEGTTFT
jgi:hypothetical protein